MQLTIIDAVSRKSICAFKSEDTLLPQPSTGDILILPDGEQYQVLQRAFLCKKQSVLTPDNIVPIAPGQMRIDFEIVCAVAPIDQIQEYLTMMGAGSNAGT